jgi:hypothetical protein
VSPCESGASLLIKTILSRAGESAGKELVNAKLFVKDKNNKRVESSILTPCKRILI